jgi:cell division GTPase FtsZ
MKEKVGNLFRFEVWLTHGGIRAIHDNLGFTLVCFGERFQPGDIVKVGNANRIKKEYRTALHARVLRQVDMNEARELLKSVPSRHRRLYGGWWHEVVVD